VFGWRGPTRKGKAGVEASEPIKVVGRWGRGEVFDKSKVERRVTTQEATTQVLVESERSSTLHMMPQTRKEQWGENVWQCCTEGRRRY